MKQKWVIHKNGLYVCDMKQNGDFVLLRDVSRALKLDSQNEAALRCPGGFKVEEYKMSYKELEAHVKKLEDLLDTFITHSNGLSKFFRFHTLNQRLTKQGEHDLVKDIEDMYNYQCHVEDQIKDW